MGSNKNVSPKKFLVVDGAKKLHPIYERYKGIKQRCYCKTSQNFKYYGEKGINICDEWLNGYDAFYDWCILNGWKRELDLDRKDNDKGYSPANCRFVTKQENSRNRRRKITVNYQGQDYTYWELEQLCGIRWRLIRERIVDKSMTVEQAITLEPNYRRNKNGHKTKHSTLSDLQKVN